MRFRVLLGLVVAAIGPLAAQTFNTDSGSAKNRRVEIALNITNAISRFAGNGVRNLNEDPYLLAFKLKSRNGNRAFRLGFNQFYTSQRTELFPGVRTSYESFFAPIFGHEWRQHLDRHFMFYFGVDARYAIREAQVQTSDQTGTITIQTRESAYGGGPFCGFAWKISPRVMLYTEGNFYVSYQESKTTYTDATNNRITQNTARYTLSPVIPTSLFLTVNF